MGLNKDSQMCRDSFAKGREINRRYNIYIWIIYIYMYIIYIQQSIDIILICLNIFWTWDPCFGHLTGLPTRHVASLPIATLVGPVKRILLGSLALELNSSSDLPLHVRSPMFISYLIYLVFIAFSFCSISLLAKLWFQGECLQTDSWKLIMFIN